MPAWRFLAQPAHQSRCLPPIRPSSYHRCRSWLLCSALWPSLSPAWCTKCRPITFSPSPHQPALPLLPSVSISLLKSSALNSTKPPTFSLPLTGCLFKLQMLGIRVFKGLQPLERRCQLKQPQLVSNMDKRVITLIDVPTDINSQPRHM
jgi:hypothetical protein